MEQENQNRNAADMADQQNSGTTSANPQSSASGGTSGGASAGASEQTFDQLMAQSPKLSPFCGWLKCLRKPALSMEYSLQKRHIPDLSADNGQSGPCKQAPQKGQANVASAQCGGSGQNSDTMGVSGSFTIRYFDFALGVLGLAIASCVMKGCCCLKRKML